MQMRAMTPRMPPMTPPVGGPVDVSLFSSVMWEKNRERERISAPCRTVASFYFHVTASGTSLLLTRDMCVFFVRFAAVCVHVSQLYFITNQARCVKQTHTPGFNRIWIKWTIRRNTQWKCKTVIKSFHSTSALYALKWADTGARLLYINIKNSIWILVRWKRLWAPCRTPTLANATNLSDAASHQPSLALTSTSPFN